MADWIIIAIVATLVVLEIVTIWFLWITLGQVRLYTYAVRHLIDSGEITELTCYEALHMAESHIDELKRLGLLRWG